MQPVLLLSHGASVFSADPANALHRHLSALGATWRTPRPRAVLVISAHFIDACWTLTAGAWPGTMHDHPVDRLRGWRYPVPGAPALAARIAAALESAGMIARLDSQRGFDHGAWLVAAPLWPAELQIPMLQLSLRADLDPAAHLQVGRMLASLRSEGVLIVTSGGMTHDQSEFREGYVAGGDPESASAGARRFDDWLHAHLTRSTGLARSTALSGFAAHPDAARAHPGREHLLPLFVGLGAAEEGVAVRLWTGFQFGLSTAAYRIDGGPTSVA